MFSGGSVIPLPAPHDPVPKLTFDLVDKSVGCRGWHNGLVRVQYLRNVLVSPFPAPFLLRMANVASGASRCSAGRYP